MSEKAQKTRYTDEELKVFETVINEKIEQAQKDLDFYLSQLKDMADNPDSKAKGLDDAAGTAEAAKLTTLAARQRKHLQHLGNAKIRIQNKVYGICRESGLLISKERLMAVPHATLSIAAKQSK